MLFDKIYLRISLMLRLKIHLTFACVCFERQNPIKRLIEGFSGAPLSAGKSTNLQVNRNTPNPGLSQHLQSEPEREEANMQDQSALVCISDQRTHTALPLRSADARAQNLQRLKVTGPRGTVDLGRG